jgi:hypothetical protein
MDQRDAQRSARAVAVIVVLLLSGIGLLFLPLGLAFVEYITCGTHYVEHFCKYVGIYHILDTIYDPLVDMFR